MNLTRTAARRAFVNPLVAATLVLIGVGGSAGMGAVWLRHEISVTAGRTRQLERRIAQVERDQIETGAQITAEQSVETLTRRNTDWHLGLVPPREPQVVRVGVIEQQRLAAARDTRVLLDRSATVATVRFQLGGDIR